MSKEAKEAVARFIDSVVRKICKAMMGTDWETAVVHTYRRLTAVDALRATLITGM